MAIAVSEVLREAFDDVSSVDVDALGEFEIHENVFALRSCIDRLLALEAQHLARWDADGTWNSDGALSASCRLRYQHGMAEKNAKRLLLRANRLLSMPLTFAAFVAGELSADQVALFVKANQPKLSEFFVRDEQMLIDIVLDNTVMWAEIAIQYWINAAKPDEAEDKAKTLFNQREARFQTDGWRCQA